MLDSAPRMEKHQVSIIYWEREGATAGDLGAVRFGEKEAEGPLLHLPEVGKWRGRC